MTKDANADAVRQFRKNALTKIASEFLATVGLSTIAFLTGSNRLSLLIILLMSMSWTRTDFSTFVPIWSMFLLVSLGALMSYGKRNVFCVAGYRNLLRMRRKVWRARNARTFTFARDQPNSSAISAAVISST